MSGTTPQEPSGDRPQPADAPPPVDPQLSRPGPASRSTRLPRDTPPGPADATGPRRGEPGWIMWREIAEQPDALSRLLSRGADAIRDTARRIADRRPRFVLLCGRGTSDHAALYAKYLIEIELGLPCGLVSMSTTTAYGATPRLADVLLITVSQSGGSPELAATTRAAAEGGAITLAVTNNPDSPLAELSEFHIDLLAGPEKALPATKTYTAELLALYLFVRGLRDADTSAAQVLPELAAQVLARDDEVRHLAGRYRFAERMVATSRGYGYPAAKEAALKLMETSYIPALAYSGADLLHGPLAMVDNISPVLAIVEDGAGGRALQPVLDRLRGRGADLVVVGPRLHVAAAAHGFMLPTSGVPESLQPVLQVLPLQKLAFEVAIARGQDPDAPRAMTKPSKTA
jgi:glucosamine--fructose-6-phosphate aminotransferase (isomerizing)